jgi:hypothetical protein
MAPPTAADDKPYLDRDDELETQRYCGIILAALILSCGIVTTIIISRQNRQTQ